MVRLKTILLEGGMWRQQARREGLAWMVVAEIFISEIEAFRKSVERAGRQGIRRRAIKKHECASLT